MVFVKQRKNNLSFLSLVPIEKSSPTRQTSARAEGSFKPDISAGTGKGDLSCQRSYFSKFLFSKILLHVARPV